MRVFIGIIEIISAILLWWMFSHMINDYYSLFVLLFGLLLFISGIGILLRKRWGKILSILCLFITLVILYLLYNSDVALFFGAGF